MIINLLLGILNFLFGLIEIPFEFLDFSFVGDIVSKFFALVRQGLDFFSYLHFTPILVGCISIILSYYVFFVSVQSFKLIYNVIRG